MRSGTFTNFFLTLFFVHVAFFSAAQDSIIVVNVSKGNHLLFDYCYDLLEKGVKTGAYKSVLNNNFFLENDTIVKNFKSNLQNIFDADRIGNNPGIVIDNTISKNIKDDRKRFVFSKYNRFVCIKIEAVEEFYEIIIIDAPKIDTSFFAKSVKRIMVDRRSSTILKDVNFHFRELFPELNSPPFANITVNGKRWIPNDTIYLHLNDKTVFDAIDHGDNNDDKVEINWQEDDNSNLIHGGNNYEFYANKVGYSALNVSISDGITTETTTYHLFVKNNLIPEASKSLKATLFHEYCDIKLPPFGYVENKKKIAKHIIYTLECNGVQEQEDTLTNTRKDLINNTLDLRFYPKYQGSNKPSKISYVLFDDYWNQLSDKQTINLSLKRIFPIGFFVYYQYFNVKKDEINFKNDEFDCLSAGFFAKFFRQKTLSVDVQTYFPLAAQTINRSKNFSRVGFFANLYYNFKQNDSNILSKRNNLYVHRLSPFISFGYENIYNIPQSIVVFDDGLARLETTEHTVSFKELGFGFEYMVFGSKKWYNIFPGQASVFLKYNFFVDQKFKRTRAITIGYKSCLTVKGKK